MANFFKSKPGLIFLKRGPVMRLKLITLIYVALVLVLTACAGQQGSAKTSDNTTGSDITPSTTGERQSLPSIVPPQIRINDSREYQNGGWLVTMPEEAGHVYRVSSDNDVWVEFSFTERMDEADVLAHLVVEPAAEISTEWSNTGYRHSLRVHVFPSTESLLRIGLSAGARNVHGTSALGEDTMVTLERFPAPWVTMYLQKYPSMKMEEYGFYLASPEEAEVVMEFTKPMNRESLTRALAGMVQPEEFKLTWLNDKKVILQFTPPAGGPKIYNLSLQGVKDQDGVLVSIPGHELKVTPDVRVKTLNLATGQQAEVIVVSGGYEGGVVSPDGSRAVFWELGSSVGDAIDYRYWLQDLTSGEKVLLTKGGKPKVKWFPGGDRVQVGNKVFSADGRELKNPLEEKHVIGFDLGPDGQLAYMSWREPEENKPNVDLFYQWDGEWRVIEGFSYQLFTSNGFPLPMDPVYDPSGERLAVVQNTAGEDQRQAASMVIFELKTGEKSLLADRALNAFWSPQGDYLAVGKVDGVEILTTAGDLKLRLANHDFRSVVGWSSEGQYLLFKVFEQSEWVTGLLEINSGQEKKIPGTPLGFDANGSLYFIGK